eukprot:1146515-Pelagomonas_calceolata.AAC.1
MGFDLQPGSLAARPAQLFQGYIRTSIASEGLAIKLGRKGKGYIAVPAYKGSLVEAKRSL